MQLFSNPSWLRIAHRGERLQNCSWHFSTNPNDVQTGRADSKHRVVSINTHPGEGGGEGEGGVETGIWKGYGRFGPVPVNH
jgi:hypothetical protein